MREQRSESLPLSEAKGISPCAPDRIAREMLRSALEGRCRLRTVCPEWVSMIGCGERLIASRNDETEKVN